MRQAWWELPRGDEGRACAQGEHWGPWGNLSTQPHKSTRSTRENLHSLTLVYRTNTCCPCCGGTSPRLGLRWSAHKSCGALSQRLPDHSGLQGLETHVVQGNSEGQQLRLIGAQQVIVGLQGHSGVERG